MVLAHSSRQPEPQPQPLPPPSVTWESVINSPQGKAAIHAAREELRPYPEVLAAFDWVLREGPGVAARFFTLAQALPAQLTKAREAIGELVAKVQQGKILPPAAKAEVLGVPLWLLAGGVGLYLLLRRR